VLPQPTVDYNSSFCVSCEKGVLSQAKTLLWVIPPQPRANNKFSISADMKAAARISAAVLLHSSSCVQFFGCLRFFDRLRLKETARCEHGALHLKRVLLYILKQVLSGAPCRLSCFQFLFQNAGARTYA